MEQLHVIHFTDPQAYLDALLPFDDSFMNFALGSFMDSLNPQDSRSKDTTNNRILLAVYKGDRVVATLTKITDNFAWTCSAPSGTEAQFTPEVAADAMAALAAFLPDVSDPTQMDSLIGPPSLVNPFIEAWVTTMQARGMKLKALDPFFTSQYSYATLATIPPPSSAFDKYRIVQVLTEEEADIVAPLAVEFGTHGPRKITLEDARDTLRSSAKMKQLWVCRVDGETAGYSLMGRTTHHTIAIRHVYVSPAYRRQGIAEAMVRALTRFYLGAEPLGFDGAPSVKPDIGTRDEVCLNVVEEDVVRLYKRCGFLLGDGDHDPVTGRKGSFPTLWRGVELEHPDKDAVSS